MNEGFPTHVIVLQSFHDNDQTDIHGKIFKNRVPSQSEFASPLAVSTESTAQYTSRGFPSYFVMSQSSLMDQSEAIMEKKKIKTIPTSGLGLYRNSSRLKLKTHMGT